MISIRPGTVLRARRARDNRRHQRGIGGVRGPGTDPDVDSGPGDSKNTNTNTQTQIPETDIHQLVVLSWF